jgi:predicted negative regulator of RcsB-dependent stress response
LAKYASQAVNRLTAVAPEIQSLAPKNESLNLEKLRRSLTTANGFLSEVQQAAQEKDAGRVEAALRKFRERYEPIRKAARKP